MSADDDYRNMKAEELAAHYGSGLQQISDEERDALLELQFKAMREGIRLPSPEPVGRSLFGYSPFGYPF